MNNSTRVTANNSIRIAANNSTRATAANATRTTAANNQTRVAADNDRNVGFFFNGALDLFEDNNNNKNNNNSDQFDYTEFTNNKYKSSEFNQVTKPEIKAQIISHTLLFCTGHLLD
ncbi:446_t:CDS:2 [Entrophospora sp. SA101]|nr:446_t:CDS:2 [Entrophospora sp. SA101]